jgi:hypothetical protein
MVDAGAFDTPLLRWESFKRLTISALLRCAQRYSLVPKRLRVCNIVADRKAVFRMIDFESLVILSDALSDLPPQDHTIS